MNKETKEPDLSNLQMSPGLHLVKIVDIIGKEQKRDSGIIVPIATRNDLTSRDSMATIYNEHPFQGIIAMKGIAFNDEKILFEVGDKVYLRRPVTESDAILIRGYVYAYIRTSDIVLIEKLNN